MSGVAAVTFILVNDQALTAVVAEAAIFAGVIPMGTAAPAIGVTQISGTERLTTSMKEPQRLRTERVQVTVEAASYESQKQVLELVRQALRNQSGTFDGVRVDSVLPDGEGPDMWDSGTYIFSQSRDFIVKWRAAA